MDKLRLPRFNRPTAIRLGASFALAVLLAGGCADQDKQSPKPNPTATELLADKDEHIDKLGVFPTEERGLDGAHDYCTDIGGVVLRTVEEGAAIACDLPGITIDVPTGDDDPDNDQPMLAACAAVDGYIRGVSASEDDDFPYPACVIEEK